MSNPKKPVAPPPEVQAVLDRINEHAERLKISRAEIARKTGINPAHVTTTLGGKKGLSVGALTQYSEAVGLKVLSPQTEGLPLIGLVAAGSGADDPADMGTFIHPHETYAKADCVYRVSGLSMRDVGILDGDILAVRRGDVAHSGDIVVAWVRDRGMLVKRLKVASDGRNYLWSEDGTGEPIPLGEEDRIHGILIGVMRNCENKSNGASSPPAKGKAKPPAKGRKK